MCLKDPLSEFLLVLYNEKRTIDLLEKFLYGYLINSLLDLKVFVDYFDYYYHYCFVAFYLFWNYNLCSHANIYTLFFMK